MFVSSFNKVFALITLPLFRKRSCQTLPNQFGFTLIELLVVVAILAILSVIGVTVYSNVQVNARDARRRSDIDAIVKALEVNKNQNTGKYQQLSNSNFQQQLVPSSTGVTKYCIAYASSPSDDQPITPISWLDNVDCPEDISGAAVYDEVTDTNPPANTTNWIVCSRLEAISDVYCLKNSQ